MDYAEALKKVQIKKPKDNYLVLDVAYSSRIILPYKDGMILMAAFLNAEFLSEEYNKPKRILPFDRSTIKATIMSAEEYERFKIAALLNISPEEVADIVQGTI